MDYFNNEHFGSSALEELERRKRTEDYNRQASDALPVNEQTVTTKTTTVINRRTGIKSSKSLYEINQDRREACIARYWVRTPRSNSIRFEFNMLK